MLALLVGGSSVASAETLNEALAEAYAANPTLNAQRASTRAIDESVPQALSGYRPQIFGNASAGIQSINAPVSTAAAAGGASGRHTDTTYPRGFGATIEQPIFDGFRTKNSVSQAENSVLAARETLLNTQQTILYDGVQAYMNVLRDFAIYDLQRNNVDLLKEELRATNERFNVGEVTRTDVAQSQSRLEGARADLSVAEANLKASRAIYRQVIGSEPTKLVPARPVDNMLPHSLAGATDIGYRQHPAILSALHAVDAAAYQVKVIQGELYPSLSLEGSIDNSWGGTQTSDRVTTATVLGRLTVPIYQGGQEYSRVREAKETLGQRRLEAEVTRDQVRAAIVSAWGALEGARSAITASQAQVKAAKTALDGVREEARVGQRTTLDVLNAEQEYLDARVTLITAQRDRVVASYAVLQAIGQLTAKNLGLKVVPYEAQVHYRQVRNKWIGLQTPDGR